MKETTAITEEGNLNDLQKVHTISKEECMLNQMPARFITSECTVTILETAHDRITEMT